MISENLSQIISLAEKVGEAILPIYRAQPEASLKQDGSPLTEADLLAHRMIADFFRHLTPDIPLLSEEASDIPFAERKNWERYWLVDPIDGTKEFLAKTGDFTVNIALIENHSPVLGVISLPISGEVYFAEPGQGAFKQSKGVSTKIHTKKVSEAAPLKMLASRRHASLVLEKIQSAYPDVEVSRRGSSLKFCLIAEGLADIYPRLGLTSEWDTAAAQCILEEAGGRVMDFQGNVLRYGMRESYLNPEFLAVGDPNYDWARFFL